MNLSLIASIELSRKLAHPIRKAVYSRSTKKVELYHNAGTLSTPEDIVEGVEYSDLKKVCEANSIYMEINK